MLKSQLLQLVREEIRDNPPDTYTPRYSDDYLNLKIAEALLYILPHIPETTLEYSTALEEGQYWLPLPPFLLKLNSVTRYQKSYSTQSITPKEQYFSIYIQDSNGNKHYLIIDYNLSSHVFEPTSSGRPISFRFYDGKIYFDKKADQDYTLYIKGLGMTNPYESSDYFIPDIYTPLILRYVRYAIALEEQPELAKLHWQAFQVLLDKLLGRETK